MRYLLDVNALVALGFLQHEFHERVAHWALSIAFEGRCRNSGRARSQNSVSYGFSRKLRNMDSLLPTHGPCCSA